MDRVSELLTLESVQNLLAENEELRVRISAVASKLEALHEYHRDQALLVAADIVLTNRSSAPVVKSEKPHAASAL